MKKLVLLVLASALLVPLAAANPSLSLSTSTTDPLPLTPGDTATVYIQVENTGSSPAEDTTIRYNGHRLFSLLQPGDEVRTMPLLGSYEDRTFAYEMTIPEDAPTGTFSLPFEIQSANSRATLQQTATVSIEPDSPLLHIDTVSTAPSPLAPGSQGQVSLNVSNEGPRSLENIDVSIDVDNTPFLTVGQTNTERIRDLPGGAADQATFQITTTPGTTSDIYRLPMTITFDDTNGETIEKTVQTGVRVGAEPQLMVTLNEADITQTTSQGEISLNVVNNGLSGVKLLQTSLLDHPSYTTTGSTSYYLGDIDSDDFDVISFRATAENDTMEIPVELTYRTSFNEEQTTERVVSYQIPEGTTQSSYLPYIIAILVIIGGVWWYRRR